MALIFLLKGLALGFSIAAPVGPIGLLCIRRSLADGPWMGFVVGLGAATADTVYGCVAAFGLTAISNFLVGQKLWLGLIGGLFLCYLGAKTFLSRPVDNGVTVGASGSFSRAYLSTFVLTVTNPMTILAFAAVFAGFGLGATSDYVTAAALVTGVFVGSAFWWLLLSTGAGLFRTRVTSTWMRGVNWFSGGLIFCFGICALVSSLMHRQ